MVQKASAEPRKVRWTLPAADTSVAEWLDSQHSVSESLRLLIREEIQRSGYADMAYKPVEQLPRRGRPPGSGEDRSERDTDDQDRRPRQQERPAGPEPAEPRPSTPEGDPGVEERPEQPPAPVEEPEAAEPAAPEQPTSAKGIPSGMSDFLTGS